jgi:hypothetical protein
MVMYLLTLVILPCNDTCAADEHSTPLTMSQAQDDHNEDNDLCSPLCACSCCSSQIILQSCIMDFESAPFYKKDFSEYHVFMLNEPDYSIWQPPKLS